jgi:hypothetical protein
MVHLGIPTSRYWFIFEYRYGMCRDFFHRVLQILKKGMI